MVAIPAPLAVGASYGLTVLNDARPAARQFALFVVSIPSQEIFARHGFAPSRSAGIVAGEDSASGEV